MSGRWDKNSKSDKKWNKVAKKFIVFNSKINQILIPNKLRRFFGRRKIFSVINRRISKFMQRHVITLTFRQWFFAIGFLSSCTLVASWWGRDIIPIPFNFVPSAVALFLIFSVDDDDDDDDDDDEPKDDGGIVIKTNQSRQNNSTVMQK